MSNFAVEYFRLFGILAGNTRLANQSGLKIKLAIIAHSSNSSEIVTSINQLNFFKPYH